MQQQFLKQSLISCPSKTLILGGYAIMNTQCQGISIGLDERFYTYYSITSTKQDNKQKVNIFSPQIYSEWKYEINTNQNQLFEFKQINQDQEGNNPFLEACLSVFLKSLKGNTEQTIKNLNGDINIYIYFDAGFYSESSQIQTKETKKFNYFKFYDKKNLAKTGLGSSACVIVSVLSCLLHSQNIFNTKDLEVLCQIANIQAQKKVGSGFDVKTSIYGSNQYQMFDNAVQLQQELEKPVIDINNLTKNNEYWGNYQSFEVPEQLKVFMIDLNKGSNTRILAGTIKKFLENTENKQKSQEFFDNTNKFCKLISQNFCDLKKNIDCKKLLQENCQNYRKVLKNIGEITNVEVEPEILTKFLDNINQKFQENVYYAICPGAGGYDAVCLLVDKKFDLKDISSYLEKEIQGFEEFQFQVREVELSQKGVDIMEQGDFNNNNNNLKNQQILSEIMLINQQLNI